MQSARGFLMGLGVGGVFALAVAGGAAWATREVWTPWLVGPTAKTEEGHQDHGGGNSVVLTEAAQHNLGIEVEPARLTTFWRSLSVPGQVVELPGESDRGVTAPVAGVIRKVHRRPWEAVRPGDALFTLAINSEFLHASQVSLRKAVQDLAIVADQKERLKASSQSGAVPMTRLLELDYQQQRLEVAVKAHRFELASRGLTTEQIDAAAKGQFLTELVLRVAGDAVPSDAPRTLEVQELRVTVGEQVQAGQILAYVTDHQHLYIEGHAFKNELAPLEKLAQGQAPKGKGIRVEWLDPGQRDWPSPEGPLQVRFFANVVPDPRGQTFPFFVPLTNQSQEYRHDDKAHRVWRYRPGQRVRLHIPIEAIEGVFVVPVQGVVREGAETYIFRQSGDAFERVPVKVRAEDSSEVAIINDGSISEDQKLVQRGAAALLRVLKIQAAGGGDEHEHHHHH